jgi:hypothetical protein
MYRTPRAGLAGIVLAAAAALLAGAARSTAEDLGTDLRSVLERQRQQLEQQRRQLEELNTELSRIEQQRRQQAPRPADPPKKGEKSGPDPDAVKKIASDYLKDNPGAGVPPGVQTGFFSGQGFVIRSPLDPSYAKWDDESPVPFSLNFHGRIQAVYYGYFPTDDANHQTGAHQQAQDANAHRFAAFSQLEIKRTDFIFEGTVYDPDLHYYVDLDGTTRGITGVQNNKVIQNAGAFNPNTSPASPIGNGVTVDHIVRLRYAYIYYDFHGAAAERGCGPDCPDGTYKYAPTYTLIAGKITPFFGLEQYLSTTNEQFVEYSMANWYFNADDNNKLMAAGTQIKALEDRFYLQAIVTNGNEAQFPNTQMDELPGYVTGFWYDVGGDWDAARKRWQLFGDSMSDIDWSCRPVARLGGSLNLVPMDRRSLYGDDEQSRIFVMPPGQPGGTRLINLLNGDGSTTATTLRGAHAVDAFDSYSFNTFLAGKYHGLSLSTEWWLRDLTNFKAPPNGFDQIWYTYTDPRTKSTVTALFPNKALLDYGMHVQGGYFLIPRKLEVVARWSWIRGESGDILGDINQAPTVFSAPNGVAGKAAAGLTRVQVNPGAFTHFHEADEYTCGFNYYFRRHLVKWQTDVGVYQGGNPAGGGASAAGFIPGVDGWLLRSELQLAF